MTETNKKLSRREAIKIVGTVAGASLLANLPSKWSKPELTGASMPAHAQTSCSDFALIVKIKSLVGSGSLFTYSSYSTYIADPETSTSGTPDTTDFTLYWDCTPACVAVEAYADFDTNLKIGVTILGVAQPDIDLITGGGVSLNWGIRVDTSTGQTAPMISSGKFPAVGSCGDYLD